MENSMYRKFELFMQERNLSPYKVSKEAGVSQPTLSDWKRGKTEPKRATIEKICSAYGLSISYFYGDDRESNNSEEILITSKDERDIAKDLDAIMAKIESGEDGPLHYNGETIDPESLESLRDALNLGLRQLKVINKEKYNPNKNKSR